MVFRLVTYHPVAVSAGGSKPPRGTTPTNTNNTMESTIIINHEAVYVGELDIFDIFLK